MRQKMIFIVILLVAAAAGIGIGALIFKPRLDTAKAQIEELKTQLSDTQNQAEKAVEKANADTNRLKTELMRSKTDFTRLNTELTRTKTELSQTKKAIEQLASLNLQSDLPPSAQAQVTQSATPAAAQAPGPKAAAGEYIIKEGDSFWKIAASQLGSGARYKEIIELNPQIPPDKPLVIGTKIKLPSR